MFILLAQCTRTFTNGLNLTSSGLSGVLGATSYSGAAQLPSPPWYFAWKATFPQSLAQEVLAGVALDKLANQNIGFPLGGHVTEFSHGDRVSGLCFRLLGKTLQLCASPLGAAKALGFWQPFCYHEVKARLRIDPTQKTKGWRGRGISHSCCGLKLENSPSSLNESAGRGFRSQSSMPHFTKGETKA